MWNAEVLQCVGEDERGLKCTWMLPRSAEAGSVCSFFISKEWLPWQTVTSARGRAIFGLLWTVAFADKSILHAMYVTTQMFR
jgi:hypothetical protein